MTAVEDAAAYRTAMGHFTTGVTVVTSQGRDGPAGLTANAVCSLSLEPLLFIVCLDRASRTLSAVDDTRRLGLNVLSEAQEPLARAFADRAREMEIKFDGLGYRLIDGVPVLEGVVAWLTGEVRELLPGGDHLIAITAVTSFGVVGGQPLVFYRGGFRSLGD